MKKLLPLTIALFLVMAISSMGLAAEETYVGYSEADSHGYMEAEVTLDNSDIVDVSLVEYNDKGAPKDEDYDWDEFHEAMEELPERFVEENSADIDTYSGATGTSEKAMDAVKQALAKADGEETFDGTYMGISEEGDFGQGVVLVTVEDENITEVELKEVDDEGEFKDEDYSYGDWYDASQELTESFVEENSAEVDVYSGATYSSEQWMEAVEKALEKAGL
ncbi:MAG: FMN-binding protein [Bacillota bacterium]